MPGSEIANLPSRLAGTGARIITVRFLTGQDEENLRKAVKAKWARHLPERHFAINTGIRNIRKGSQYGLTWDMVDWRSRELHIPRTKNEKPLLVQPNAVSIGALTVFRQRGKRQRTGISGAEQVTRDGSLLGACVPQMNRALP